MIQSKVRVELFPETMMEWIAQAELETGLTLAVVHQGKALPPLPEEYEAFAASLAEKVEEAVDAALGGR
jgi:hypothetical protein